MKGAQQGLGDHDRRLRTVADNQQSVAGALWIEINAARQNGGGLAGVEQSCNQAGRRVVAVRPPDGPEMPDAECGIEIVDIDLIQADGVAELVDGRSVAPQAFYHLGRCTAFGSEFHRWRPTIWRGQYHFDASVPEDVVGPDSAFESYNRIALGHACVCFRNQNHENSHLGGDPVSVGSSPPRGREAARSTSPRQALMKARRCGLM